MVTEPARGPVFVVGCPRSGTTLLTLMLHAHSRIAMPPETRFLMDVYRRREEFGDLADPAGRRRLARAITRRKGSKFADLGLDRAAVEQAVVAGPPTVGGALGVVFGCYADRFGKARWGDKRPTYFQNLDAIRAMFPSAQFVHLVRDGRDAVASLQRVSWYEGNVYSEIALWTHAVDTFRRARRRLPPGTCHELRYEDLLTDPEAELRALCAFLGEEFEPAMLEPHKVAGQAVPARKRWHELTRGALDPARIGGHEGQLEPWELRIIHTVAGRRLSRLGYEVPADGWARPWQVARYLKASTFRRWRAVRAARTDARLARPAGSVADPAARA